MFRVARLPSCSAPSDCGFIIETMQFSFGTIVHCNSFGQICSLTQRHFGTYSIIFSSPQYHQNTVETPIFSTYSEISTAASPNSGHFLVAIHGALSMFHLKHIRGELTLVSRIDQDISGCSDVSHPPVLGVGEDGLFFGALYGNKLHFFSGNTELHQGGYSELCAVDTPYDPALRLAIFPDLTVVQGLPGKLLFVDTPSAEAKPPVPRDAPDHTISAVSFTLWLASADLSVVIAGRPAQLYWRHLGFGGQSLDMDFSYNAALSSNGKLLLYRPSWSICPALVLLGQRKEETVIGCPIQSCEIISHLSLSDTGRIASFKCLARARSSATLHVLDYGTYSAPRSILRVNVTARAVALVVGNSSLFLHDDNSIRLLRFLPQRTIIFEYRFACNSTAISADGTVLLCFPSSAPVFVVDTPTGITLPVPYRSCLPPVSVSLSTDGTTILVAGLHVARVFHYDKACQKVVLLSELQLQKTTYPITGAQLARNGQFLVLVWESGAEFFTVQANLSTQCVTAPQLVLGPPATPRPADTKLLVFVGISLLWCLAFLACLRVRRRKTPYTALEDPELQELDVINTDVSNSQDSYQVANTVSVFQSADFLAMEDLVVQAERIDEKGFTLGGGRWLVSSDSLGQGGFGVVRQGMDVSSGTFVAIKTIQVQDTASSAGFSKEVRVMLRLSHPQIVQYIYHEITRNTGAASCSCHIVMEYCAGGSLESIRQRFGPLAAESVAAYAKDIIAGLTYLHANGVVHRDLKPHNVLLTEIQEGGAPTRSCCKLADFGLSRVETSSDQVTVTAIKGTIAYMAPEVIMSASASPASDIWAFALTLVRLLSPHDLWWSLRLPPYALMRHIAEVGTHDVPEEAPSWLADLLSSCLQRDPIFRPSASQLRQLLRAT
eukprot:TRINITY_DN7557_c0_g1_i1.p1 TRINITY_DN7557_c0_g1~~TRINITY_DN7557_c0_g1_i1.p1  ORF type:complete len:1032 (-),score=120.63 TRINITY_DN7557_c0_g1_i1:180-2855(-)